MPHRTPDDWGPVRMVTDGAGLQAALDTWQAAGVLGLDTEANSFYAYHDRLCLLQVTADGADYIVDPLALGEDLEQINPLLADPGIVKVFHAAEFDLMLLKKDLGASVHGLFDTQVAMTLLHPGRTGLAALIGNTYGVQLSKKEQRSNWGRRPLTPAQIAYARVDTHFLPDLHRRLRTELTEAGLGAAADGEFRRLEVEVLPARVPDPEGWRKLKGARQLDPAGAARLRALFLWRENLGQEKDLPVFRVLGNAAILDLAARPPRDARDLAAREGVGWRKARQVEKGLMAALAAVRGQEIAAAVPKPATPEEVRRRRIRQQNQDALRQWRKQQAAALGLPSERLMHRRHLEEIGRRLPRSAAELLDIVELNDWQRQNLEHSLLALLETLPDPDAP